MNKHALLTYILHRPYPLPKGPWVMQQSWQNLVFLHYKVSFDELRRHVPSELELDHFNNDYWVSISPLEMKNIRFRSFPAIPTAHNFLELNFRTYVKHQGRAGIYFFSLDTSSSLAALGARLSFLPYYRATMKFKKKDSYFFYSSERLFTAENGNFQLDFKPTMNKKLVENISLDQWLVERYCLFQKTPWNKILRIDIHHLPWELQDVEVYIGVNTLGASKGIHIPEQQPKVHYSQQLDVLVWPPKFS
jgi:uncharacterized protein